MVFDIDTTGLLPGDTIDAAACRKVIGKIADDRLYTLHLLQLKNQIAIELLKRTGRELTLRIRDECICILTDAEAAEYNPKAFDNGLNKARRAHKRLLHVDPSKLSEDEKQRLGSNVTAQAFKLLMLKKRQPVQNAVSVRSTPTMLKK
jgi:hypothetical protein